MAPEIRIILIEWRPAKQKVTVRGTWLRGKFSLRDHPILEPGNIQHACQVFDGVDMGMPGVGFEGLCVAPDEVDAVAQPWHDGQGCPNRLCKSPNIDMVEEGRCSCGTAGSEEWECSECGCTWHIGYGVCRCDDRAHGTE